MPPQASVALAGSGVLVAAPALAVRPYHLFLSGHRNGDHMNRVKIRFAWWSLLNLLRGYQFRPVQRCRRCSHTTPYHYPTCEWATGTETTDG